MTTLIQVSLYVLALWVVLAFDAMVGGYATQMIAAVFHALAAR